MQYITIEKLSVFSPAETFGTLTKYIQAIDAKVSFEWIDILLSSLFLAISALVLWKEISKGVLTDFLQNIFSSERKTLYLLLACSLLCATILCVFSLFANHCKWNACGASENRWPLHRIAP